MIRYSFFALAIIATAATAIASVAPTSEEFDLSASNVTVVTKNQAFPIYGPLIVEDCMTEDCSEANS